MSTLAKPRRGIYGGTFNPIHLGHLRAAQEVLELLELERMVFVPSASPPHKHSERGAATIAPAADRLEWVRLAIDDHPCFEVDDLELTRGGSSYTVDTLRVLARDPADTPVFVIGRDAFVELGTWREPREVTRLAHLAVTTRPPVDTHCLSDWLPDCLRDDVELAADGRSARHRKADTWIRQLDITALDISASAVRERIRSGRSVRYLVPEHARAAIVASGAYCDASLPKAASS